MAAGGRRAEGERSFIERARRDQIIAAAIETIAEHGYTGASYSRIAKRAGLSSTGMISYYFGAKTELIAAATRTVVAAGQEFMVPRFEAETSARGRLRAYIESNLEFMRREPAQVLAVVRVLDAHAAGFADGENPYSELHEQGVAQLVSMLDAGQAAGELGEFSAEVVARTIRAAIDAVAYRLGAEPRPDLAAYASELVALFDRSVAAGREGDS